MKAIDKETKEQEPIVSKKEREALRAAIASAKAEQDTVLKYKADTNAAYAKKRLAAFHAYLDTAHIVQPDVTKKGGPGGFSGKVWARSGNEDKDLRKAWALSHANLLALAKHAFAQDILVGSPLCKKIDEVVTSHGLSELPSVFRGTKNNPQTDKELASIWPAAQRKDPKAPSTADPVAFLDSITVSLDALHTYLGSKGSSAQVEKGGRELAVRVIDRLIGLKNKVDSYRASLYAVAQKLGFMPDVSTLDAATVRPTNRSVKALQGAKPTPVTEKSKQANARMVAQTMQAQASAQ